MKKLVVGALVLGGCLAANAATYPVSTVAEFKEALAQAAARTPAATGYEEGDVIQLAPGDYYCSSETGSSTIDTSVPSAFEIDVPYLTIRGTGSKATDVVFHGGRGVEGGNANLRCFAAKGNCRFENLTIDSFSVTGSGGGAYFATDLQRISNVVIRACSATVEGGALKYANLPAAKPENRANSIDDCSFIGNFAPTYGTITWGRLLQLNRCHFEENGGKTYPLFWDNNKATTCTIADCTFVGNTNSVKGDQSLSLLYVRSADGSFTNCTFSSNIYSGCINGGATTYVDCKFLDNVATYIYQWSSMLGAGTCRHCTFSRNNGILSRGAKLYDCTFEGNTYGQECGSCAFEGYASNCTFRANACGVPLVYSSSASKVARAEDCLFICNTNNKGRVIADNCSCLVRCTVVSNYSSAANLCGANGAAFVASNSLFVANSTKAPQIARGTVVNCTFADNAGGAIFTYAAKTPVSAVNTILWGNAADFAADIDTLTNCLYDAATTYAVGGAGNVPLVESPFTGAADAKHPYGCLQDSSSPAHKMGLTLNYGADSLDLAHEPRLYKGFVDAGCYQIEVFIPGLVVSVEPEGEAFAAAVTPSVGKFEMYWKPVTCSALPVTVGEDVYYPAAYVLTDGDSVTTNSYSAPFAVACAEGYDKSLKWIFSKDAATMSLSVEPYAGRYDRAPHGVTVTADGSARNMRLRYRVNDAESWTDEAPTFTAAGTNTVHVWLSSDNCDSVYGEAGVSIDAVTIADAIIPEFTVFDWEGVPVTPEPEVDIHGVRMQAGEDYALSYAGNEGVGFGSVTVTGTGSVRGFRTLAFYIRDPEGGDAPMSYAVSDSDQLRVAIAAAALRTTPATCWEEGDVIVIAPGVHDCAMRLGQSAISDDGSPSAFEIDVPYLTVRGQTGRAADVTLKGGRDAGVNLRCFAAKGNCRFTDLTIDSFAVTGSGGGAYFATDLQRISNVVIRACSATVEGGALKYVALPAASAENRANSIDDCSFIGNEAKNSGTISWNRILQVNRCHFEGNAATDYAIFQDKNVATTCTIADSTFVGNGNVGLFYLRARCGSFTNCTFSANRFGKTLNEGASVYDDCTFEDNITSTLNQFASIVGAATCRNCAFRRNNGIISRGAKCYGCIYEGNTFSTECGSCVFDGYASNCIFRANACGVPLVYNFSGTTVTRAEDCLFVCNTNNKGRVIAAAQNVMTCLDRCTIVSNCSSAANLCGNNGADVIISNCLFAANSTAAPQIARGTLVNCTFADNAGGAIFSSDVCTVVNSVFWNNTDFGCDFAAWANCAYDARTERTVGGEGNVPLARSPFSALRDDRHPYGYVPTSASPLRGGGLPLDYGGDSLDLSLQPRLSADGSVDIGCYQRQVKSGFLLLVR